MVGRRGKSSNNSSPDCCKNQQQQPKRMNPPSPPIVGDEDCMIVHNNESPVQKKARFVIHVTDKASQTDPMQQIDPKSDENTMRCSTKVNTKKLTILWNIEGFDNLMKFVKPGKSLESATIKDPFLEDASWGLRLYPGGKTEKARGKISCFLILNTANMASETRTKVAYRFFMENKHGRALFNEKCASLSEFYTSSVKREDSWGLEWDTKEVTDCILEDGSVIIKCEVEVAPDWEKMCLPAVDHKEEEKNHAAETEANQEVGDHTLEAAQDASSTVAAE